MFGLKESLELDDLNCFKSKYHGFYLFHQVCHNLSIVSIQTNIFNETNFIPNKSYKIYQGEGLIPLHILLTKHSKDFKPFQFQFQILQQNPNLLKTFHQTKRVPCIGKQPLKPAQPDLAQNQLSCISRYDFVCTRVI